MAGKESDTIMQVHVSPHTHDITISAASNTLRKCVKAKAPARHASFKRFLCVFLVLVVFLPFVVFTPEILTLEDISHLSGNDCSWRKWIPTLFYLDICLENFQFRTLLSEAGNEGPPGKVKVPNSYSELIAEIQSQQLDAKTAMIKLKGMVDLLDQQAKAAKLQGSIYRHFASSGIPKGLVCLSLKLTLEYSSNSKARQGLPSPKLVPHITDSSLHHYVLASDNVLAASVVVRSTIANAANPGKIVFHVVTDKNTYAAMHAWFALNLLPPATVEVKGVHQFDWLRNHHALVLEALQHIPQYSDVKGAEFPPRLQFWSLKQMSDYVPVMDHLRIYLPELFPKLRKVILLDHDVVIQRDLSQLWNINLKGKVNGAVEICEADRSLVAQKTFKDYLNFSHPLINQSFDSNKCAWAIGMNIFDLERWRQTNITQVYNQWLRKNMEFNFTLWRSGRLPPLLIAFNDHVHLINPVWHMIGLGHLSSTLVEDAKKAFIVHYNGPAKPWLEIADQRMQPFWGTYVNYTNELVQECNLIDKQQSF